MFWDNRSVMLSQKINMGIQDSTAGETPVLGIITKSSGAAHLDLEQAEHRYFVPFGFEDIRQAIIFILNDIKRTSVFCWIDLLYVNLLI